MTELRIWIWIALLAFVPVLLWRPCFMPWSHKYGKWQDHPPDQANIDVLQRRRCQRCGKLRQRIARPPFAKL